MESSCGRQLCINREKNFRGCTKGLPQREGDSEEGEWKGVNRWKERLVEKTQRSISPIGHFFSGLAWAPNNYFLKKNKAQR